MSKDNLLNFEDDNEVSDEMVTVHVRDKDSNIIAIDGSAQIDCYLDELFRLSVTPRMSPGDTMGMFYHT